MIDRRRLLAVVALGLIGTSCGAPEESGLEFVPASSADLLGRSLLSSSVTVGGAPMTIDGPRHQFNLVFKASDLRFSSGCNSGGAQSWQMVDGRLVIIDQVGMTLMSCPGQEFEQDRWFAGLLSSRPQIYTYGREVVVTGDQAVVDFVDGTWSGPGSASPADTSTR